MQRWPNKEKGPFEIWTTVALIDGRPEVVGVEMWAIDPAALDEQVTHLTPAQANDHWPRSGDTAWENREGFIQTKDLRLPLGKIVAKDMERQRRLAWTEVTPGFREKIAEDAKRFQLVSPNYELRPSSPERRTAANRVLELTKDQPPAKSGRKPLPREHYVEVAKIYTEALRDGAHPTKAVMDKLFATKEQASKWVYRCRRPPLNLLAPTRRGMAASTVEPEIAAPKRKGKQ
jgi:hypothetical protein